MNNRTSRVWMLGLGLSALVAVVLFLAAGGGSPSRRFDPAALNPALTGNPEAIRAGQEVFSRLCAPCHGAEGQGKVGPSLRDDQWLHGNTFSDVARVIAEGVQEKSMIAWKDTLSPLQISQVTAYVLNLSGLPAVR